jgi:hypothetical protein
MEVAAVGMPFALGNSLVGEPTLLLTSSVTFFWLPDKLDLLSGMTLGAGLGAGLGGFCGLMWKWLVNRSAELENSVVLGTVAGLAIAAAAVVAGNLKFLQL